MSVRYPFTSRPVGVETPTPRGRPMRLSQAVRGVGNRGRSVGHFVGRYIRSRGVPWFELEWVGILFWPWFPVKSPQHLCRCSLFARKRHPWGLLLVQIRGAPNKPRGLVVGGLQRGGVEGKGLATSRLSLPIASLSRLPPSPEPNPQRHKHRAPHSP